MTRTPLRKLLLAVVIPLALVGAACGDDDGSAADTTTSTAGEMAMDAPFGEACDLVPADGAGSFDGMADEPVATAASNNPVLSTLVTAVGAAGLGDTLNTGGPFTVFAPANPAFEAIPADQLDAILADTDLLTSILTYHVIGERLSPDALQGDVELETLNGATISVSGDGEMITVNGNNVICGNVQTANATVYIIDGVLVPEG